MTDRTGSSPAETLARYRSIRASIQAALAEAVKLCRKPDFDRAAKHLRLANEGQLDDDEAFAMLCDVALCEPNQRGRRVIDDFLKMGIELLDPAYRNIAHRLGSAFFSIFRIAGRHGSGGVWLDDLLAPERRIWLMDEGLETSAPEGLAVAMRVFDAGPFHAGFGFVVQPDAETVSLCADAAGRGRPTPFRHSLAATLYGDAIAAAALPDAIADVLDRLALGADARTRVPRPTGPERAPSRRARR